VDDVLGIMLSAQQDPQVQEEVKELDDDSIGENLLLM
jgi:hypothetical protein